MKKADKPIKITEIKINREEKIFFKKEITSKIILNDKIRKWFAEI